MLLWMPATYLTWAEGSPRYSCSYSHAKQSTYRAFNAVFGKVGRVASSEVSGSTIV